MSTKNDNKVILNVSKWMRDFFIFLKHFSCFSYPLPNIPGDERVPDRYCNVIGYEHLSRMDRDEIYCRPSVGSIVYFSIIKFCQPLILD